MTWTVPIQSDSDGEFIIEFPEDMMEELNWEIGDKLQWIDNGDGTYSIKKHENSNPE